MDFLKKRLVLGLLFLIFTLFGCDQTPPDTPEAFIARLNNVAASGDGQRFLPELVLSRAEHREFLIDNWANAADSPNPDPAYHKMVEMVIGMAWKRLLEVYSAEKLAQDSFFGTWSKFEIDSITFDTVASLNALGEKRAKPVKEMAVIVSGRHPKRPDFYFQVRFPCALSREGKWKLHALTQTRKWNETR